MSRLIDELSEANKKGKFVLMAVFILLLFSDHFRKLIIFLLVSLFIIIILVTPMIFDFKFFKMNKSNIIEKIK